MMYKTALSTDWDFGTETSAHIITGREDSSVKTASEAFEFASNTADRPNHTKIVVIAMGASDSYGPNRNADGFRRSMLEKHHPSFTEHGTIYVNHKNKNPKNNYGDILGSFFRKEMDRVELVLSLCNRRAAKFVRRINEGDPVPVSMGIHIPHDICNICGHKAPTTKHWCEHMQRGGRFGPNTIYYVDDDPLKKHPESDGKLVYVDNPSGRFFDISIVTRPADMIAYQIYGPGAFEKTASQDEKRSSMIKRIEGIAKSVGRSGKPKVQDSKKTVECLSQEGVSGMEDLIKQAHVEVSFPTLFRASCVSLFGKSPSPLEVKLAAAHQSSFVEAIEEYPALNAYIRTSFHLGEKAAEDSIAVLRYHHSKKEALEDAERSDGNFFLSAKEASLASLVAASMYSPTEESVEAGVLHVPENVKVASFDVNLPLMQVHSAGHYIFNESITLFSNKVF